MYTVNTLLSFLSFLQILPCYSVCFECSVRYTAEYGAYLFSHVVTTSGNDEQPLIQNLISASCQAYRLLAEIRPTQTVNAPSLQGGLKF